MTGMSSLEAPWKALLQPVPQQGSIRQIGERIVRGLMDQRRLRLQAFDKAAQLPAQGGHGLQQRIVTRVSPQAEELHDPLDSSGGHDGKPERPMISARHGRGGSGGSGILARSSDQSSIPVAQTWPRIPTPWETTPWR